MEKIVVKKFDEFSAGELYELLKVRAEVFVVEQNCVYQDMDGKDYESFHVIGFEKENIAAYLRVFMKDKVSKTVQIGRVLTVQRGKGFGEEILREGIRVAKEEMHAERVYIEAQCYAIGFYEKVGFQVSSGEFLEDGIPHVEMILELV